ncbi:MAG: hypothetical protein Q8K98_06915 [Bacteroidota bacterium]|nr:hypothetical protein [Bacteroidota bacterium]
MNRLCRYYFIGMVAVLTLQFSCKDKIVAPPIKNPREYTWTMDTIAYPGSYQTAMRSIYATAPNNVYIVGHNDGAFGKMYRYDGKKWQPVDLAFGLSSLSSIYGFGQNNIWAVGHTSSYNPNPPPNFLFSSKIIQFDGVRWNEHSANSGSMLQTVWGSSPNDIWAAGGGTLFHYDGLKWTKQQMDPRDGFYHIHGLSSNEIYLLGIRTLDSLNPWQEYHVLLRYNGFSWSVIDSVSVMSYSYPFGVARLGSISGTMYSLADGVYSLRGGVWKQELTTNSPLQCLYASSSTNAFVVGQNSLIYHYDGQTWQQLMNIVDDGWWFTGVWNSEKEAFIVGYDAGGYKTIVLRGK